MIESSVNFIDGHLARLLLRLCKENDQNNVLYRDQDAISQIIQRLVAALFSGHSCVRLKDEEINMISGLPIVSEDATTPLVLQGERLYLQRYYQYERQLAAGLRALAANRTDPASLSLARDSRLFLETEEGDEPDMQRAAVELALCQHLCIISGGPGTGKTTTVVKLLRALEMQYGKLKIVLSAPTGKAAMRLKESVYNAKNVIKEGSAESIPEEAFTLHRLLGISSAYPMGRFGEDNPMDWDVVIVDEASMVDLAMMSKLVCSLKANARLILLGDKDQLSSVESGAVLADCMEGLAENRIELTRTYRFNEEIKKLAGAVIQGAVSKVMSILGRQVNGVVAQVRGDVFLWAADQYRPYMKCVQNFQLTDVTEVFDIFFSFSLLCAVKNGFLGVASFNRNIELLFAGEGYDCQPGSWYHGRPVMVTKNDYSLGVYNGDVGICLRDRETGKLEVWFEKGDGSYRNVLPSRLGGCETVYAMTVHKSQGSEFTEVGIVLPDQDVSVVSRQLLYTAVTRAKQKVYLAASEDILTSCLNRSAQRVSGLVEMLQEKC